MKKLAAILSALLMILAITPAAFAAVYTEGYFHYTIEDESITITGYFGSEETVTVPAMIAGIPVNTIASGAFAESGIKVLNLPDTITSIESGAIDLGVKINYNSNLPQGGQTQPSPNPPAQDNPQPNPPQSDIITPGLPGGIIIPPTTQSSTEDNTQPDDINVSEDSVPDDVDGTEPSSDDGSQTDKPAQSEPKPQSTKPAQTEPQSTKPAKSDESSTQPAKTAQTEPSAESSEASSQSAIEEVEIELDLDKQGEVTAVPEDDAADTEETSQAEKSSEAAAEPEPTKSASPKTAVYAVIAAAAVAALAVGGFVIWKKNKSKG